MRFEDLCRVTPRFCAFPFLFVVVIDAISEIFRSQLNVHYANKVKTAGEEKGDLRRQMSA